VLVVVVVELVVVVVVVLIVVVELLVVVVLVEVELVEVELVEVELVVDVDVVVDVLLGVVVVVVVVVVSGMHSYVVGVQLPSAPHTTVCDPMYPGSHVSSAKSPNTPVVVFVVPCGGSCGGCRHSTGMQPNWGSPHIPLARHTTVVQSPDPLSDPDPLSESPLQTTRYPVRHSSVA
jgi:hypothetical protein